MAAPKSGAILLGLKKGDEEEDVMDMEGMDITAKEDAASALADAVKGGDSAAIVDAFQTMYDLCASKSEDDTAYEEESEELEM